MGNSHFDERAVGGGVTRGAYDGLVLTTHADPVPVLLGLGRADMSLGLVSRVLRADRIEVERLNVCVYMWRNPEALLEPDPQLNFGAMWLTLRLRGPFEVPVIFGDVVITGSHAGQPAPIGQTGIWVIQRALGGRDQDAAVAVRSSRSPKR